MDLGLLHDLVYDVGLALLDPRGLVATMRAEGRGLGRPLFFVLFFGAGVCSGFWVPLSLLVSRFIPIQLSLVMAIGAVACGAIVAVLAWIAASALYYAYSRLLGGQGSFDETLALAGYSAAGFWVTALLGSIAPLIGWLPGILASCLGALLGIAWHIYIACTGLSEVHGYSAARGLVVVILSGLTVPVLLGLLAALASML